MSTVWFVTGSSSGFGLHIVTEALAAGNRVVATLRNPDVIKYLTSQYGADKLLIYQVDVTKPEEVAAAFDATQATFGSLDVVVNNAGYGLISEVEGTPDEEARRQLEVNFWGAVHVTRNALRFFREVNPQGKGGLIFHISSMGGFVGNPASAFYSASKFAMEGFTESIVKDLPPEWNIRNVIIEPGGFKTSFKSSMLSLPQHPAYSSPDSPTSQFRGLVGKIEMMGDPIKAARVLLSLAKEPKLPLRIQLGADCWTMVRRKAQKVLEDLEEWEQVSKSTIAEGAFDYTHLL
ncbi:hypothetical protein JAAARDRAFT_52649 [Jaapia argillacea MUCL 33604]|uniref:NAD(P)-binding protein n=1 Tax=Jaapia argillacea MUCL 33604 TaxID=933084 RepID=A0A067QPY9_9AGAM|nr:hypothetical protein JAAARDRAFT_52649 [Jaapia argillacea MUCL 33604]